MKSDLESRVSLAIAVLAVAYAFVAGFRTVGDFDLGWQIATGRYVIQHRAIPSTELFSYTAAGTQWIYPPLSGVAFYLAYLAGGYAALSWMSALATAATVGLVLAGTRTSLLPALLAAIAVPVIALRTYPRADLFSTALAAAVMAVLWRYREAGRGRLWLLPLLMAAWANLHLGFLAGLGLMAAYVAVEALDMAFPDRREGARRRLVGAAPWLAGAVAATLINPWGPRLYVALARQSSAMRLHRDFIGEWSGVHLGAAREALAWRSTDSSYWWLLFFAVACLILAAWRRQFGVVLLIASALAISFLYVRFQALFAVVLIVAGGSVAQRAFGEPARADERGKTPVNRDWRWRPIFAGLLAGAMLWLVGVRVADLVSNRQYLSAGEITLFGTGPSWWYPERAIDFIRRENLPGNLMHDYNLGGYLTWRLGDRYKVYIDGRAVPYGTELFLRQRDLLAEPPESAVWQREADRYKINTMIFSVARYAGLGSIPLQLFCESQTWRPVYLDEVAVVFVRNQPENAPWIDRLAIDCGRVKLVPPAVRDSGSRAAAELYNFHANAGPVYYMLARDAEAFEEVEAARRIYPHDANLYLTLAQLLQATGRASDAVAAYERSLRLKETDAAWYGLGRLHASAGRFDDAERAIRRAASISLRPHERYRSLAHVHLAMNRPNDALRAFDEAEKRSPYDQRRPGPAAEFHAQLASGRAAAWRRLGDLRQATALQEEAVRLAPRDPSRWGELAELYRAQGQTEQAAKALAKVQELRR